MLDRGRTISHKSTNFLIAELHDVHLTRYIRLLMAILFLTTALFGTVANANATCEGEPGSLAGDDGGHGHDHSAPSAAAHAHQDITKSDEKLAFDGGTDNVVTACHANAGCPGCVLSFGASLPSNKVTTIAFRHMVIEGKSTEPDSSLRPPKFS